VFKIMDCSDHREWHHAVVFMITDLVLIIMLQRRREAVQGQGEGRRTGGIRLRGISPEGLPRRAGDYRENPNAG